MIDEYIVYICFEVYGINCIFTSVSEPGVAALIKI